MVLDLTTDAAYVEVGPEDYERRYPRPGVLEVCRAQVELHRLDELGALGVEEAPYVRVLLAVVGRLGADSMAVAFPPASTPRHLAVVDAVDAVDAAEAEALVRHRAGRCHLSEWSCSHCEAHEVEQ